jgi:ABC-type uncharacterized transport system ATPase subunit
VIALAGADLELRGGEVHGVVGANGAGKTTLLSILGGILRPDSGTLTIEGAEVVLASPREAWALGVALVHQHFTLVPALTVLENLALGLPRGSKIQLDLEEVRAEAHGLMARTGLTVPLEAVVEDIGVGDRQRTEILKALLRDPKVLVLDEPTAVLTPQEVDGLFALLRELAGQDRAVVLVAHKLDEVLSVADHITVLRSGRTVMSVRAADAAPLELVRAMIGVDADDGIGTEAPRRRRSLPSSPTVARLDDVSVGQRGSAKGVERVTLEVARGEIVGIAGVEGNGQHQLALLLAGRIAPHAGSVALPPGIGFIPQDRSIEGIIPEFDFTENVALALHNDARYRHGMWLRWDALAHDAAALRARYDVAASTVRTPVGDLSGGNQQRVVVGRELMMATDLLVAENPTRGLDVAAAAFVRDELRRLTDTPGDGPGVVLLSTDLDEILELSDRVCVMNRGRLRPVPAELLDREGVGALMLSGESTVRGRGPGTVATAGDGA